LVIYSLKVWFLFYLDQWIFVDINLFLVAISKGLFVFCVFSFDSFDQGRDSSL